MASLAKNDGAKMSVLVGKAWGVRSLSVRRSLQCLVTMEREGEERRH